MHILIVDDSPTHAELCRITLKYLGHKVDIASDGAQAINKISQASYDCVFMDCLMPEMSGFEATEYIRKSLVKPYKDAYIIGMSATSGLEQPEKCLQSGMNDFIIKPLSKELFQDVLFRLSKNNNKI